SATCGTTNLLITDTNATLIRTLSGTIPGGNPTMRTTTGGDVIELDTTTPSGWAQSVSGGYFTKGTGGGPPIRIDGVHLVNQGHWDHTASTAPNAELLIINPGNNRIIEAGTVVLQHNVAKYVATSVFENVAYNGTSCFPQSGTITTTFAGSRGGT